MVHTTTLGIFPASAFHTQNRERQALWAFRENESSGVALPDPTVVNLSPEALIYQGFLALFLYKKMKYFIKIT